MKKLLWILIIVVLLIIFLRGSEDSWIKDDKGQYVKHGMPSETPDYVQEQQTAVICALSLYQQKKNEGVQFSSQCLGTCGDFVVDMVHAPRTDEDNLVENQCKEYREGKASKFIELDKEGNIVRIA